MTVDTGPVSEEVVDENLFKFIDNYFSGSSLVNYSNLIGVGSDGTNSMFGERNSVLSNLKEHPSLISYHCNCNVAALIANHTNIVLPDYLDDYHPNMLISEEPQVYASV